MTVQHSNDVLYMAMELSNSKWKLRFGDGSKARDKTIDAGQKIQLMSEIGKAKQKLGLPAEAPVKSCYEAGRDGFWIHRFLEKNGVENLVVDPASIEVNRRKRRAKTDRLDAEKLLVMLLRYHLHGEKTVWQICHVPSEEAEDERRAAREMERLTKERTAHSNRIGALLALVGIKKVSALKADFETLTDWEGKPLRPELLAELNREQERLIQICNQIKTLQSERRERLANPRTEADEKAAKLNELKGVGPVSSWMLAKEFFGWRDFKNRRQVGACAGLTGTPYDSGGSIRDQGISKAGSARVRRTCTELAWNWVRHQPRSKLTIWFVQRFSLGGKRMRRIGITALARKLLIALWKYLEFGEMPEGAVLGKSLRG